MGILVATAMLAATDHAQAATLKFGSFEPPQGSPARNNYIPWMRAVEKDSNGAVTFQEFWGGQLSRAPDKQFELMMNGIQDSTVTLPSYTQARFPEFSMFELPFTFNDAVEGAAAQWRMYEQGLLSGLDKVKVVAIYNNGNSSMHFNKKIAKLEDVKGLKIRSAGPEEADLIAALGAAPVAMSISQVAESLNRGVIDGTLNGFAANTTFKITPLLKAHFEAPFGVRTFFFSLRKDAYDALPEAARKAIDANSGIEMSKKFASVFEREGEVARTDAKNDPQRTLLAATPQQQDELRRMFRPQHERWIKEHQDGQRKYDALQKILAEMRGGRS
jgi:TRAP-type C4-dicarboxylate transport system substrate-binding protein